VVFHREIASWVAARKCLSCATITAETAALPPASGRACADTLRLSVSRRADRRAGRTRRDPGTDRRGAVHVGGTSPRSSADTHADRGRDRQPLARQRGGHRRGLPSACRQLPRPVPAGLGRASGTHQHLHPALPRPWCATSTPTMRPTCRNSSACWPRSARRCRSSPTHEAPAHTRTWSPRNTPAAPDRCSDRTRCSRPNNTSS
jgi:hypothetical protein